MIAVPTMRPLSLCTEIARTESAEGAAGVLASIVPAEAAAPIRALAVMENDRDMPTALISTSRSRRDARGRAERTGLCTDRHPVLAFAS
jgi:hypothetical protein